MRRRNFIAGLASTTAALPLAARAQQPGGMRFVGVMSPTAENDAEGQRRATALIQGLQELGWTQGRNIHIDFRWCGTDSASIRKIAADLVRQKPEVIVGESSLTVAPLQQLTHSIPIVFVQIADPVENGFVTSMAKPAGNITGFTPVEFSTYGKLVEVLKEVAPQVNHIVVIYSPVQAPQLGMLRAIQTAAPSFHVQITCLIIGA